MPAPLALALAIILLVALYALVGEFLMWLRRRERRAANSHRRAGLG